MFPAVSKFISKSGSLCYAEVVYILELYYFFALSYNSCIVLFCVEKSSHLFIAELLLQNERCRLMPWTGWK